MSLKKVAATAVLAIAPTVIASVTANAAPVLNASSQSVVNQSHVVNWSVTRDGSEVLVRTDAGSLSTQAGHLVIRDSRGDLAASVPLSLVADDGMVYPVAARVRGNTATLETNTDRGAARRFADKFPGARLADLNSAISATQGPINFASTIGGFLGAAAGLVGGCLLGAAAGAALTGAIAEMFGAGPIAGCVIGAVALGSGAGLAGTVIGGLGTASANAPQFMQQMNQPTTTSK